MNMKEITVICTLLSAAALSHAEGFYVLGSVGQSHFSNEDVDESDLRAQLNGVDIQSSKLEKNDTGYKLQVGYQVNENFAIEGGYVDLGRTQFKANGTLLNSNVDARVKEEASGLNVAGLLTLPINGGFSIFFKGGIIRAKVKVSGDTSGSQFLTAADPTSVTKVKANAGVGVSYNFIDSLSARIEAERFAKLGDGSTGKTDVDLYSVGLSYHF